MKTQTSPLALLLLLSACGSPPPPADPVAPPASASASAAPLATTAPTPTPPAPPIDPSLPKSAAFMVSADLSKLVEALANPEIAAIAKGAGFDANAIALASIDAKRPLIFAIFGVSDDTRAALTTLTTSPDLSQEHVAETLTAAAKNAKPEVRVRAIIPSTDVEKTIAAIALLAKSGGLAEKSPGIYETRHARLRASKTADAVVVDAILGEGSFDDIDNEVKKGRTDPPSIAGLLTHIRYYPRKMGEIQMMNSVMRSAAAIGTPGLGPNDKARIAHAAIDESTGGISGAIFDEVDVIAKVDAGVVSLDLKTSDTPAAKIPSADAFKPSAAVAIDHGTGAVSVSGVLARGWVLPAENAGDSFVSSAFADAIRTDPTMTGWIALPMLAPVLARMFSHQARWIDRGVYEKADRAGFLYDKDGAPLFFELLPKDLQGEAAECFATGKPKCDKEARLKIDGPSVLKDGDEVRLIHVKGTKALAIISGKDKQRLLDTKLSSTTAPAFEFSIPRHTTSFDIPGLAPGAHINATFSAEGHASQLHVEAK